MRKARRAAEGQQDPGVQMPYPQYGYPPAGPQDPNMYMAPPYNQAPVYQPVPGQYYAPQPMGMPGVDQSGFNMPTQILQNPAIANMALQYGQSLVGQGKEVIDQKINQYVSTSRIKYFFSVDTAYVAKKLGLVLFPFTHRDWSIKFNPEQPVQPRDELNAPDLYIPSMAFVTYVLIGGVSLGLQERFSPESLGIQASTALVWQILEILAIWLTLFIMSIQSKLTIFDILAFSSYKYVGMIVVIAVSLVLPSAYHIALIYVSAAVMFFLVRSLKVQVLPETPSGYDPNSSFGEGSKRRTYLLLFMGGIQPLLMWWLTRHLALPVTAAT